MSDPNTIPLLPREVIEWLERAYPERTPYPKEFDNPILLAAEAGRRELVRNLRLHFERQNSS